MRKFLRMCAAVVLIAPTHASGLAVEELEVGDPAPAFSLPGSDGKTYNLANYKGKQTVVLAWFAKAFTGG